MKTKHFQTLFAATALTLSAAAFAAPASAQNFVFEENGSATGEFELNFTESKKTTWAGGAEYDFNGGAGSEGEMNLKAKDYTVAVGVSGQYAGGTGTATSDTNGHNYAKADFASGAFNANAGLAFDQGPGKAKISYDGSALAGGAGGANTGLSSGKEFEYSIAGDASGKYTLKRNQTVMGSPTP